MTNPSSPRLPEEIYLRRRVAAAVGILVLVGLLVWGLVAFAGRGGEADTAAASSTAQVTTTEATTTSASKTPETTETTTSASSSVTSATSEKPGAEEPKNGCQLSDLRISASSDRPSYPGDVQPTFYMTVENPTTDDCEINLNDHELRFEVYNLETNERVWADTDCYPSVLTGDELFKAEDKRRFQAVWSRMGSRPGQCNSRQDVGTGSFYLHAVLGDNPSDAHPFNLG